MGLMAIEMDRRDFLTFARGRRSGGGQPPRRDQKSSPGLPQPPDFWSWFNRKISRRDALGLGVLATTLAGSGYIAHKLGWLFPTVPDQTQESESLEHLVAQAKRMEDEYKGRDLSDKTIREKYAAILTGIFAFHDPGYLSRQQLRESIIWTDSVRDFTKQRILSSGRTGEPTLQQISNEQSITAATDNRRRKITVNAGADVYKQENIVRITDTTYTLNPLKMFRLSLLHELNHLVTERNDDVIFSIIDPNNQIKDKRIEGFRFVGINKDGTFATVYNDIHEAVIELLAKDISQSDFGSYYGNFPTGITGEDVTVLINQLEQILQVTGISHQELATMHKNSDLRGFLLKLSDKAGVNVNAPLENRIRLGSIIVQAIESNDQRILQDYIRQVSITR